MGKVKIYNVPQYADKYRWIVYRTDGNDNYFYGAYNELDKAVEVCKVIDGTVTEAWERA